MGIEVVHHQHQLRGFRVDASAAIRTNMAQSMRVRWSVTCTARLPANGSTAMKTLAVPRRSYSLSYLATWPGLRRQRIADLSDQLLAALVHADHGSAGVVWAMVHLQDVFHRRHEFGRGPRGQAPAFLQPRLELVFFSVRRTVS